MANLRQAVVMRRDLGMTAGLAAAQASHLNDMWLREAVLKGNRLTHAGNQSTIKVGMPNAAYDWLSSPVLSVLSVDTPEELDVLIKRAKDVGVSYRVWKDTIPSQVFSAPGKPYFIDLIVGVAFGPDDDEKIKQVTGGLPLW